MNGSRINPRVPQDRFQDYEDGNRIDLTLIPLADLDRYLAADKLTVILLDKDNRAAPLPPPSDEDYHIKKPSPEFFDDCCNEFWWVSTYIAKGLCRGELLYAAEHLALYERATLLRILSWQAGIDTGFSLSAGKSYKYLPAHIPRVFYGVRRNFFAIFAKNIVAGS
jgi:aminoglycoside 6-adenylyltransferase